MGKSKGKKQGQANRGGGGKSGGSSNNLAQQCVVGCIIILIALQFSGFLSSGSEDAGGAPAMRIIPREDVKMPWPKQVQQDATTATGGPSDHTTVSNQEREVLFYSIHGGWPPRKQFPGATTMTATEEWDQYMFDKERRLMAIEDPSWRWERWLEQVQIRTLRNWTASGWGLDDMPEETHSKVLKYFTDNHEQAYDEGKVAGYIAGERRMLNLPFALKDEVTYETQKLVAEWAGYDSAEDLEPTSTYGIRVYYNQSVLETHVDRVETHILSAVYCVDRKHTKPWPMETDPDLLGNHAKVDVPPGKLFFYESAKLSHGRPSTLDGEYYAHLFIHFRPKGWSYRNSDRVYGVPPWFHVPVGTTVSQLNISKGEDTSKSGGKEDLKLEL